MIFTKEDYCRNLTGFPNRVIVTAGMSGCQCLGQNLSGEMNGRRRLIRVARLPWSKADYPVEPVTLISR